MRTRSRRALATALAVMSAAGAPEARSGESVIDKSVFHLLNPTPSEHLRDLTIDGPGATESPYTVDAGHFQIEMTLVGYTSDRTSSGGVTQRLDAWAIAPVTVKVGLLNKLDAQLVLETYNLVYERAGTNRVTRRGFGNTTARLKYNLWGNDGGSTAFAAMPYIKFPTSAESLGNDGAEGGLILPVEAAMPRDFYLGLTARFKAVRDKDEHGNHAEFEDSVALGHELFGDLFGYVEFFSAVSMQLGARWVATFDTGLIYSLNRNLQMNAGVNIGVTRSADDWDTFVGVAWRY